MNVSEEQFKLALATDLIIFLVHIWTHGNDQKIKMINELMNKWSERIEGSSNNMKVQIAEQIADQSEETTKDVAMILLDANNIHNTIVKGEFKTQMREAILKGMEVS